MFAKVNRRLNPSYPSWIKAGNSTPEFIQPLLTLKESEGLNLTEWYWPGLRAPRSLGRGRPLASSFAPPAPQAPSARANPMTTNSAANMGAAEEPTLHKESAFLEFFSIGVTLAAPLSREVGERFLTCSGNISWDISPSASNRAGRSRRHLRLASDSEHPRTSQTASPR